MLYYPLNKEMFLYKLKFEDDKNGIHLLLCHIIPEETLGLV